MELYLVNYQMHWENHIDIGRAVVQATDEVDASRIAAEKLNIPVKRAQFSTEVISGGFLTMSRRSVATPPGNGKNISWGDSFDRQSWHSAIIPYNCKILAIADGQDEYHALRRVAHAVINKCNDPKSPQDRHVSKLMLDVNPRMPGHER
jgi:hypothetical protein